MFKNDKQFFFVNSKSQQHHGGTLAYVRFYVHFVRPSALRKIIGCNKNVIKWLVVVVLLKITINYGQIISMVCDCCVEIYVVWRIEIDLERLELGGEKRASNTK